MEVTDLVARYPRLFHMAEAGSWPSIEERGLLSTTALLDLFEVNGAEREAFEAARRPRSATPGTRPRPWKRPYPLQISGSLKYMSVKATAKKGPTIALAIAPPIQ